MGKERTAASSRTEMKVTPELSYPLTLTFLSPNWKRTVVRSALRGTRAETTSEKRNSAKGIERTVFCI
jgi:hypothetical protein